MAIVENMEYAKERGRWWAIKHPYLHDDMLATAMLALVQAFKVKIPEYPKAYISRCIDNAMVDLLESNYLIQIPRSEIQRRKDAEESLASLPRAMFIDEEELWDLRYSRVAPPWMGIQVEDVAILLELTDRERHIIVLRTQGYSNTEIGLEFEISKQAIQHTLQLIKGRYLILLSKHSGIMRPNAKA